MDDREMGSLPPVRLPSKVPQNAWNPAKAAPSLKRNSRFGKSVQATSIEAFYFSLKEDTTPEGLIFSVRLPGFDGPKTILRPSLNSPRGAPKNVAKRSPSHSSHPRKSGFNNKKPKNVSVSSSSPRPIHRDSPKQGRFHNHRAAHWGPRASSEAI